MHELTFKQWLKRSMKAQGPRSQKAYGLSELRHSNVAYTQEYKVWPLVKYGTYNGFNFCRPCPMVPRPGFVDSRIIVDKHAFTSMLREIYESGEEYGEVIMMPYMDSLYSGIIAENSLTIGASNDGATSGKPSTFLRMANDMKCVAYSTDGSLNFHVEFVHAKTGFTYLVQKRKVEGKLADTRDIVPETTVVKRVVNCNPGIELIDWESTVNHFEPGTAVYGENMSPTGHHALHCVMNKVPFFTTRKPKVGEVVEPIGPDTSKSYSMIAFFLYHAMLQDIYDSNGNKAAIAAIQSQHMWGSTPQESAIIGYAIAALAKMSVIACIGELRHTSRFAFGESKESLYKRYSKENLFKLDFDSIYDDFKHHSWGHSYGGPKWAARTRATKDLVRRIASFIKNPSEKRYKGIILACNKNINSAHNTGRFLNKFLHGSDFNIANMCPGLAIANMGDKMYMFIRSEFDLWIEKQKLVMDKSLTLPRNTDYSYKNAQPQSTPAKPEPVKTGTTKLSPPGKGIVGDTTGYCVFANYKPAESYWQVYLGQGFEKPYGTHFSCPVKTDIQPYQYSLSTGNPGYIKAVIYIDCKPGEDTEVMVCLCKSSEEEVVVTNAELKEIILEVVLPKLKEVL